MALRRRRQIDMDGGYQPGQSTDTPSFYEVPQPQASDLQTQSTPPPSVPPSEAPSSPVFPSFVNRDKFDAMGYLNSNPDVSAAMRQGLFNRDPYAHYTQYGWREGRNGATAAAPPPTQAASTQKPAEDRSTWNTDGYQAPVFQPTAAGGPMAGWDAQKWGNTAHQTPKYGVGRILSNYAPTVQGLQQAIPEITRAYPGTTFDGKDKLTIPGVGTIDVLVGASQGGNSWAWQDLPEMGVTPYTPQAPANAQASDDAQRQAMIDLLEGRPLRTARYRGAQEA